MRPPAGYRQPRTPDEIGPYTTEAPPPIWSMPVEPMPAPKITGYRTLTGAEIAIINRIKAKAEEVRELLAAVRGHDVTYTVDPRWLAIGETDLQKGFMAVIRAVARPETF